MIAQEPPNPMFVIYKYEQCVTCQFYPIYLSNQSPHDSCTNPSIKRTWEIKLFKLILSQSSDLLEKGPK